MASIRKQKSGHWRAQVRRNGHSVSETFIRRDDAQRWAANAERTVDTGERPRKSRIARLNTFGHLIDLHIADSGQEGPTTQKLKLRRRSPLMR